MKNIKALIALALLVLGSTAAQAVPAYSTELVWDRSLNTPEYWVAATPEYPGYFDYTDPENPIWIETIPAVPAHWQSYTLTHYTLEIGTNPGEHDILQIDIPYGQNHAAVYLGNFAGLRYARILGKFQGYGTAVINGPWFLVPVSVESTLFAGHKSSLVTSLYPTNPHDDHALNEQFLAGFDEPEEFFHVQSKEYADFYQPTPQDTPVWYDAVRWRFTVIQDRTYHEGADYNVTHYSGTIHPREIKFYVPAANVSE